MSNNNTLNAIDLWSSVKDFLEVQCFGPNQLYNSIKEIKTEVLKQWIFSDLGIIVLETTLSLRAVSKNTTVVQLSKIISCNNNRNNPKTQIK